MAYIALITAEVMIRHDLPLSTFAIDVVGRLDSIRCN